MAVGGRAQRLGLWGAAAAWSRDAHAAEHRRAHDRVGLMLLCPPRGKHVVDKRVRFLARRKTLEDQVILCCNPARTSDGRAHIPAGPYRVWYCPEDRRSAYSRYIVCAVRSCRRRVRGASESEWSHPARRARRRDAARGPRGGQERMAQLGSGILVLPTTTTPAKHNVCSYTHRPETVISYFFFVPRESSRVERVTSSRVSHHRPPPATTTATPVAFRSRSPPPRPPSIYPPCRRVRYSR